MPISVKPGTLALAVALVLSLTIGIARATPGEELRAARTSFLAGKYDEAIAQLTGLLYPTSRLADASDLAEAHLLLGVSFFETGKREAAEREFEEALFLDPSLKLDATNFSEDAIRFFEASKANVEGKEREAAERQRRAEKAERLREAINSAVIIENRRYFVNFIPFGAGQFQNGHKRKGALFFIGEALTGGLSAGLWSFQVIRYGFRGRVPREEVGMVNTIQITQITSGALFFGLMAWGIIDSLSNYEHTVRREADPAFLDSIKDLFEEKPAESSLRIVPMASPDGAGAILSWEF